MGAFGVPVRSGWVVSGVVMGVGGGGVGRGGVVYQRFFFSYRPSTAPVWSMK